MPLTFLVTFSCPHLFSCLSAVYFLPFKKKMCSCRWGSHKTMLSWWVWQLLLCCWSCWGVLQDPSQVQSSFVAAAFSNDSQKCISFCMYHKMQQVLSYNSTLEHIYIMKLMWWLKVNTILLYNFLHLFLTLKFCNKWHFSHVFQLLNLYRCLHLLQETCTHFSHTCDPTTVRCMFSISWNYNA